MERERIGKHFFFFSYSCVTYHQFLVWHLLFIDESALLFLIFFSIFVFSLWIYNKIMIKYVDAFLGSQFVELGYDFSEVKLRIRFLMLKNTIFASIWAIND